jgi:FlaA1/EpsC-like NDP-sugar epimerase
VSEERSPLREGRPVSEYTRRHGIRALAPKLRVLPVIALDALLVVACYAAALALKFDGSIPRVSMVFFGKVIIIIVLAYILGNYFFGIYRTAWQYASLADAVSLASAVILVSILLTGADVFLNPRHIPLTVTATAPPIILISMGVSKLWPRLRMQVPLLGWGGPVQHVLIVGGGATGQMLAREFLQNPKWEYKPSGFVDDDPRKQGVRIHGLPVLGDRYDIPALVESRHIDVIALAMPSATGATIRDLLSICQQTSAAVRTVPGVLEMVDASGATRLREITVDDLLARDKKPIDLAGCAAAIRGREVLITGAAGYLGAELAHQLLDFGPAVLHLLDTNETGLYDLQRDLKSGGADARIWVTDIVDRKRLDRVFRAARPQIVFHTAAYKHIPVIEEHPEAAFYVNVVGTMNVCLAADDVDAERVVFISSNKAAELDSVYGATKRIGELLVTALGRQSRTKFCAVRLHNVMGSRGSVVPLFLRQIERGGPVQLTHADVTRHFMSPPEVVRLLIQATAISGQGQVLVVDLGEEVRIADLAEKLIRLRGYQPGKDIQVVYTGLRPGEQLREKPLERRGAIHPTEHSQVFFVEGPSAISASELVERIDALQSAMPENREQLVVMLHALARIDKRDVQPATVSDA